MTLNKLTYKNLVLFFLVLFFLTSCSIKTNKLLNYNKKLDLLYQRLKDRGVLAVSPTNNFIASNLLLSELAKQSEEVKGFLDENGYPSAIEVKKGWFSPALVKFYYPDKDEYYKAEVGQEITVIEGPFPIENGIELAKVIKDYIPNNTLHKNTINAQDKQYIREKLKKDNRDNIDNIDESSVNNKQGKLLSVTRKAIQKENKNKEKAINLLNKTINKAPMILAEILPTGDLVHYVADSQENLFLISLWYTKNINNAGRLARINNISINRKFHLGDSIIIPSYLLKNKKLLQPEYISNLKKIIKLLRY